MSMRRIPLHSLSKTTHSDSFECVTGRPIGTALLDPAWYIPYWCGLCNRSPTIHEFVPQSSSQQALFMLHSFQPVFTQVFVRHPWQGCLFYCTSVAGTLLRSLWGCCGEVREIVWCERIVRVRERFIVRGRGMFCLGDSINTGMREINKREMLSRDEGWYQNKNIVQLHYCWGMR